MDVVVQTNEFIEKVNQERKVYWKENGFTYRECPLLTFTNNRKYIKIIDDTAVWGFIAKGSGDIKGAPIRRGDLLKPANFRTPAKHARGNILDGSAKYDFYGPEYIK